MQSKIEVRLMREDEAGQVRVMGRRAFSGFESLWVSKPKLAMVAIQDGRIVGAILYKFIRAGGKKIGYVDYAFVDRDRQGQGIGGVLYRETVRHLWAQGCDALTAIVKDDNVGSWGPFVKNGFTRVSLPEICRQFGLGGAIAQYFATPLCIGIGMEYYVALRERACPSGKEGSAKQIAAYAIANLLLAPLLLLRGTGDPAAFVAAFLLVLGCGVAAGYLGTRLSRRAWRFRLNNGGALICALVSISGVYPFVGNWYPERYENTKAFRRDMGLSSLPGWAVSLALAGMALLPLSLPLLLVYAGQISAMFLLYRVIPFYPFESFGGRRVLNWNRYVFFALSALSLLVMAAYMV